MNDSLQSQGLAGLLFLEELLRPHVTVRVRRFAALYPDGVNL